MNSSISMIIAVILSIYHHSYGVSADYQLILSQRDVRVATFDPEVKTTFLENPRRPNGYTFTNIGNLNPADFVGDNGYYRFKLVYTNLHDYDVTNKINNDLSVTLEWKQTSWLTATTITGYIPINVPTQTNTNLSPNSAFVGLGLASTSAAFLDGNADLSATWNSAGRIFLWNGGIPAFNEQVAFTAALYVYSVPDCSVFDIDDYLLQCSYVFPSTYSAQASPMGFIENDINGNNGGDSWIKSRGLNVEDLFLGSLFAINFIGMIYIYCRMESKEKRSFNGKKYTIQFDEEIDEKAINK